MHPAVRVRTEGDGLRIAPAAGARANVVRFYGDPVVVVRVNEALPPEDYGTASESR
jgi:hypothetical protein